MEALTFTIYTFQSRRNPVGRRLELSWKEFCDKLSNPIITEETMEEYAQMTNEQRTDVKDVGGYVAGELRGGRRSKQFLTSRQIVTIDADEATPTDWDDYADLFNSLCFSHTTHSSTPGNLRLRWLFPLTRPVNAAEYRYLAQMLAEWVGAATVDESTDQPERLMFWPSCSFEAPYDFRAFGGEMVNPDDYLPADLPCDTPAKTEKPISNGVLEIAEGQRNKTVFGFAANLRGQGLDYAGIREMLDSYNERYCNPPLDDEELDTISRSVCSRYAAGEAVALSLRDAWDDFHDMGEWVDGPRQKPALPEGKTLVAERASDLARRDVKAPEYVVDNLISTGITILASPPKFGKSWMCMDMAISIASGTPFMGIDTVKKPVMYMALEDGDFRLKERSSKVAGSRPIPEDLFLVKSAPILADGLLACLTEWSTANGTPGVIIIDTLQKVRGTAGKTEGVYGYDYRELGQLHQYALDNNIAIILVHHLNKGGDDSDFVGRLNGSTGISGAADSIITLIRGRRGDRETKMSITGRDITERTLIIEMDWGTYKWTVVGEEHEVAERRDELEYESNPIVKTIVNKLDDFDELREDEEDDSPTVWQCTSSELLDEVERMYGPQGQSPESMGRKVQTLADKLLSISGVSHDIIRTNRRRTHVFTRELI